MQLKTNVRNKLTFLSIFSLLIFWLFVDDISIILSNIGIGGSLFIIFIKLATVVFAAVIAYIVSEVIINSNDANNSTLLMKVGNDKLGNSIVFLAKSILVSSLFIGTIMVISI